MCVLESVYRCLFVCVGYMWRPETNPRFHSVGAVHLDFLCQGLDGLKVTE